MDVIITVLGQRPQPIPGRHYKDITYIHTTLLVY